MNILSTFTLTRRRFLQLTGTPPVRSRAAA